MTTFVSTVPGAIECLETHFENVATANPSLDVGVYVGPPNSENWNANYLMIGERQTGRILSGYKQEWRGFPAVAARKLESPYTIPCSLRAASGSSTATDVIGRLNDAFTMMDGVLSELQNDPQASGALSPSGSWQVTTIDIPATGVIAGFGWGVLMTFGVQIINVQLPTS